MYIAQKLRSQSVSAYLIYMYQVEALPQIVALRQQGNNKEKAEMENCIDALYGATLLRMQGKELSAATQSALKPISDLLRLGEECNKS